MKLFTDWGFSGSSWKGERGEYLLALQAVFMVGFILLPVYAPLAPATLAAPLLYGSRAIALVLALLAVYLMGKGLIDLGRNLTPLPYPRADGQLVQTGAYGLVRHPLYSGIVLAAISTTVWFLSLTHLIGAIALFALLDYKASREETWLSEKYPDYSTYRDRVKKLLPWLY